MTATRSEIARLFVRVAFGATASDLDTWAAKPYEAAVEFLLAVPDPASRVPASDDAMRLKFVANRDINADVGPAQRWWLERMRATPYPLEERMTLLWHDHFATAVIPLPSTSMLVHQNQTIRLNALGNFRTLAASMVIDTAMLYWLGGRNNVKGKPNENYAREQFELFTLGTIPQVYSESDVRAAAKILTGWNDTPAFQSTFTASKHDTTTKTVLGRSIPNGGDREYLTLLDVILAQQIAPLWVAQKLVRGLAYEPPSTSLLTAPDPLVAKVAAALQASNWDIKAALRVLLLSTEFRATPAGSRELVRPPIDLVVSACKAIGISASAAPATATLFRTGQLPFKPPNVAGWPHGTTWLTTTTALARYDWGHTLYGMWAATNSLLRPALPAPTDLAAWAARFGLAGFDATTDTVIGDYLAARRTAPVAELREGLMALIVSSPDWMVM